jgi:hypothetical protein
MHLNKTHHVPSLLARWVWGWGYFVIRLVNMAHATLSFSGEIHERAITLILFNIKQLGYKNLE